MQRLRYNINQDEMAHQALHGGKISSQLITQSTIHLYLGKEMIFINTIIMQTRKLIAPNAVPRIVQHPHPQNALADCPFMIVNNKYLQDREKILKYLVVEMELTDHAIHHPGEDFSFQSTEISFALSALLKMCQQLSEVATAMNKDDINPFYLFLNPILKYRQYCKMNERKRKLHLHTQYINQNDELNIEYFLVKLHTLEDYLKELNKMRKSLVQGKFVKICVIALLKHFLANHKSMQTAAIKLPEFQKINNNIIEILTDLSDYSQKLEDEKRTVVSYFTTFDLDPIKAEPKPEAPLEPLKERIIQAAIKPVAVTLTFLTLMKVFAV